MRGLFLEVKSRGGGGPRGSGPEEGGSGGATVALF